MFKIWPWDGVNNMGKRVGADDFFLKFHFSDGSAPSYATETRMEERINPADEAKIKMPRKREAEATKQMPDGAKGPKFTKKQMEKEVNKRSAAQFGNLTDY